MNCGLHCIAILRFVCRGLTSVLRQGYYELRGGYGMGSRL